MATGLEEGLIITHGIDDVVTTQNGLTVHMRPLWRWLCEADDHPPWASAGQSPGG